MASCTGAGGSNPDTVSVLNSDDISKPADTWLRHEHASTDHIDPDGETIPVSG